MAAMMIMSMVPTTVFASVVSVEDTETLWDDETASFRICSDYWADIVTEQPTEYVADASAKTVSISTPEALVWFGKEVNSGKSFAGYTITIAEDLDLSGHYWTPIDTATIEYVENGDTTSWKTVEPTKKLDNATIDGGGHTITGLTTATGIRGPAQPSVPGDGQNCYYYSAFIGRNDGTLTIENLTFDGASIAITEPADGVSSNGSSMCAVVAALNTGELTLDAVTVSNSRVLAMQKAAALLGMPNTGSPFTANQCAVTGCTISAYYQVAPVVGYASQDDVSIQGVRLEDNTVRVIEQQGENWAYRTDESGNQYYSYQNSVWTLNAGEVAVFHNGEADSSTTDGSVPSMVAEVNGYQYDTLAGAIAAAENGDTVTLLQDVSLTETIEIQGKSVILDLAGHIVQNQMNGVPQSDEDDIYMSRIFHIYDGASLTVNGTAEGSGMTIAEESAVPGIFAVDMGGTLTLNGGSYTGNTSTYYASSQSPNYYGNMIGIYDQGQDPKNSTITLNNVVVSTNYCFLDTLDTIKSTDLLTVNVTGGNYTGQNRFLFHVDSYSLCPVNFDGTTATMDGRFPVIELDGSVGTFDNCTFNVLEQHENNYSDSAIFVGYEGKAIVNSGTYTSAGTALYIGTTGGEIEVNGGVLSGQKYAVKADASSNCVASVVINGGNFVGTITTGKAGGEETISITGGYFSSDPSEYAATGYAAVSSDDPDYAFMVAEAADTDVAPATGEPAVDETQLEGLTEEEKEAVLNAAASVEAEGGELAAAANGVVGSVEESQVSAAKSAYKASGIDGASEVEDDAIYIYAQTYLSITPTEYDATAGTLTLDIQPMYRVVASVVNDADQIDVEGENQNAVVLAGSEKELNNIQRMTITITLPNGFAAENDTVYIQHKVYEYSATADSNRSITFTNPNGFSEFKFSKTTAAVAQIGDTRYTDLQDAVNAVENDETITLLADGQSATVSRAISFAVESVTGQNYTANITPSGNYSMTYDESTHTYTFTYSGGGGGSSGTTRYTVTVEDSANGEVSSSHSRASRGTTVTLTITPDDGYILDELVVTDANGDELDLTRNSRGQYTFTMPRSRVTVEASFVEGEEPGHDCPSEDYDDLSTSAWYHSAVDYVLSEGMMSGISQYEFAPDNTLTRAMVVQILWAMEGRPQVNYLMQYDDVSESAWYAEAVRWGVSEGIVSGYSESTFGPEDPVTREQLALILYNYAKSAGYGADEGGMSIREYNDYGSISAWALEAMEWSVNAGLISGKDGSRLDPAGTATRAEAAQMLMNLDLLLSEV